MPACRWTAPRPPRWITESGALRRVLEAGLVAAAALQVEIEWTVVHAEQIRDDLTTGSVVARDHAGHRLLGLDRLADAHRDLPPGAKPAPTRCVVDLDCHMANAKQGAGLPDPRELQLRRTTETPQEDAFERLALTLIRAFIDVEHEAPGRPRLVVVIPIRKHGTHTAQLDLPSLALLDLPGKRSEANTVGRAPPLPPADSPTRADH